MNIESTPKIIFSHEPAYCYTGAQRHAGTYKTLLAALLPGLIFFTQVNAQDAPTIKAVLTSSTLTIDGELNEEDWQKAEPVTGFLQFEPTEGAPSANVSEVRVLFGDNSLYIGALLSDDPEKIERALGRRDEYNRADWFIVSLDSYFNRRNAYTFGVSAAGVQLDGQRTGTDIMGAGPDENSSAPELPPGLDISWDAIWSSSVKVIPEGWVVEMRIPYSMLRFPESDNQTWGIHFTRRMARLGEIAEWPLIPRTERNNLVAQFGRIVDITGIHPRRNIQVRPYVLASLNTSESESRPGKTAYDNRFDAGGDVKIGLGPSVMLDMTVNPDFGQIESDPAMLNLTAFETIYPEKRQFFIEGVDIFEFSIGPGTMFYSRRIGDHNPIIGAVKLSGRTAGRLSFGLLVTSTGENFDPENNYAFGRMSQQLGNFSSFGAMASMLMNTSDMENGSLRSFASGLDWDIRNKKNTYGISGMTAYTHRDPRVAGIGSAAGSSGRLVLSKHQGTVNGLFALLFYSDKFNPNDIGQLQENNFYEALAMINYEINGGKAFSVFQRATASLFMLQRYSYDDLLDLGDMIQMNTEWTTQNFSMIRIGSDMNKAFSGYDIYETRGLGPWKRPSNIGFSAEYITDQRRNWKLTPAAEFAVTGDHGTVYSLSLLGNWSIGNRLALSGGITGIYENSLLAWASNESFTPEDGGWKIGSRSAHPSLLTDDEFVTIENDGRFDGIFNDLTPVLNNRYYVAVFGNRDTRSFDLTLRSNFSFNPYLSLQLYGQFFLARGIYKDYQILISRDDLTPMDDLYPKQLDFSYKSLVSNLVLRWEYLPGSTVYVVWSHGRNADDYINPLAPRGESPYDKPFGMQVKDMFDIFPENAFIIKLSYTFL